jgi:hypothetical protein
LKFNIQLNLSLSLSLSKNPRSKQQRESDLTCHDPKQHLSEMYMPQTVGPPLNPLTEIGLRDGPMSEMHLAFESYP